jgi:hypothetical protein
MLLIDLPDFVPGKMKSAGLLVGCECGRRLTLRVPNRPEHRQHVFGRDRVKRLRPQRFGIVDFVGSPSASEPSKIIHP